MDLHRFKFHRCSCGQDKGILLVDIDSETTPRTDARGNRQYYCPAGRHIFAVDAQDNIITRTGWLPAYPSLAR